MDEYIFDEDDARQLIDYQVPDIVYDVMTVKFGEFLETFLSERYKLSLEDLDEIVKEKYPEKFI